MKNLNWYNIFDKNEPNKKSAFMTICATSKKHAIEKITEVCGGVIEKVGEYSKDLSDDEKNKFASVVKKIQEVQIAEIDDSTISKVMEIIELDQEIGEI